MILHQKKKSCRIIRTSEVKQMDYYLYKTVKDIKSGKIGIVMEIDLVLESVYAVFLGGGMWLKLGEFVVVKE